MKIDLKNAALIVLDYQNDIAHEKGANAKSGLIAHIAEQNAIANTKKLLEGVRKAQGRIIFVHVEYGKEYPELKNSQAPFYVNIREKGGRNIKGTWGTEIHAELAPRENETMIPKSRINPFTNKKFGEILKGYKTLILAGVSTNYAVEVTARTAADMDFQVIVAEDCCASRSKELHDFSVKNILPDIALVLKSKEILKAI